MQKKWTVLAQASLRQYNNSNAKNLQFEEMIFRLHGFRLTISP